MQTQQQVQQPNGAQGQGQKRKWFLRRPLLIVVIVLAVLALVTVGILSNVNIIPSFWASIISTIVGVLGIVPVLLLLIPSSNKSESSATPSPSLAAPDKPTYRRILGLPPPIDPKTIQQREQVVKAVYTKLASPDITTIVLTGMGGIGKSTLAALIYHYAELQRHAGGGSFTAEPLWLSVDPPTTMIDLVGNLFDALGKPQPDFSNLSPQSQAKELFKALNTMDRPRLVILDQFENLLDPQTGHALVNRPGVGEWLDALNNEKFEQSGCRVLLTSRLRPKGTREYSSLYMQEYEIKGLETMEGIDLLRKLEVEGTEAELREAVERSEGHALALTLLAGLLQRNRSLSLAVLFNDPLYAGLWTGDIARNLLDYTYKQQLDDVQRKLLLAFSVYREAVPLAAAQTVADPDASIPRAQLLSAFEALLAQHLLQPSREGRYRLHAIVASYAQAHFDESDDTANLRARQAAHAQAARYYLQQAKTSVPPREKRRHISDIHDLTEATWQLCEAGQWQEAYDLMQREGMFADLRRWGGNAILLELCKQLLPLDKWHPEPAQAAYIYNHLGRLYDDLGNMQEARTYYEQVLSISREIGEGRREGVALNNLGRLSKALGETEQAQAYFEQALNVCKTVGDRGGEGTTLNNLGPLYATLGRTKEARTSLEQALSIFRNDAKYPPGEARALNSLGRLSADLGEKEQARDYYQQALSIYRKVGDRRGEAQALNNLGNLYVALEQAEQARTYLEQALSVRKELGNRWTEAMTLNDLGKVYDALGEKERAQDYYQQASAIFSEERGSGEEG